MRYRSNPKKKRVNHVTSNEWTQKRAAVDRVRPEPREICPEIKCGASLISVTISSSVTNHLHHPISKMKEEEHPNPDEEQSTFLNFDEDLVQLPTIKASGTSEIDFDRLLEKPLKLREDLKDGCGGQLWPAGMVLAKYMLRKHRHSLENQKMSVSSRSALPNRTTDIRFSVSSWELAEAWLGKFMDLNPSYHLLRLILISALLWQRDSTASRSPSILLTKSQCWSSWNTISS